MHIMSVPVPEDARAATRRPSATNDAHFRVYVCERAV